MIVWFAYIIPPLAAWVIYRTKWGLHIRAVGDNSQAVATAGLSVKTLRYGGVFLSGAFAGLGGCALALTNIGYFVLNMTAGRGFIVLAAFVVGKWNPIGVAMACLFFGMADALQLRMQTIGSAIPHQFFIMLPYLLTIAALAGLVGRTRPPVELGIPYDIESH